MYGRRYTLKKKVGLERNNKKNKQFLKTCSKETELNIYKKLAQSVLKTRKKCDHKNIDTFFTFQSFCSSGRGGK